MNKQISMELVKELRARTGIAVGKCKEALEQAGGDMDEAIKILRKAGLASAVKKEGRETKEGIIAYAESPSAIALVEINAETDFVVKNQIFQEFALAVAKQAAKSRAQSVADLLAQPSTKDPSTTIDHERAEIVQTLGENIRLRRVMTWDKSPNRSVAAYSHMGGKLVVVVEIEGASDQQELGRDVAMHIAAESPDYIDAHEIPQSVLEHEREIAREQVKGKPAHILDKAVEGKVKAYLDGICLLSQKYVKNPEITVGQLLADCSGKVGKKLAVKRFARWGVGEGSAA
jgi:elongation factor Ts